MHITSISVVKNESDIIESFVRFNLKFIDHMHIIDHTSSDSTPTIINKLIDDNLPITLHTIKSLDNQQGKWTTDLARKLALTKDTDIIIPIDADEFILFEGDKEEFNKAVEPALNKPVLYPWVTYAPSLKDEVKEVDALKRITYRRKSEGNQFYKTIVSAKLILNPTYLVATGAHVVGRADNKKVEHQKINNIKLAHFPIRGEEQMLGKIVLGELSLRLKSDRKVREGFHWADIYKKIRDDLAIEYNEVCNIASGYASNELHELVEDPVTNIPYNNLTYSSLIDTNVLKRVVAFAEQIASANVIPQPSEKHKTKLEKILEVIRS